MSRDLSRPSVWLKGILAVLRHDKTREAIGVLAMAAAVLTLASLATFDPQDPSFFSFAGDFDGGIRNAVGRVGAELAGDLLGLLGLMIGLLVGRNRFRKVAFDSILVDAPKSKQRLWAELAQRTGGRSTTAELR